MTGQRRIALRYETQWGDYDTKLTGSTSIEAYRSHGDRWRKPRVQRRTSPLTGMSVNFVVAGIGVSIYNWKRSPGHP